MQMELLRCLTLLIIVLATATACRVSREGVEDEELVNKRDGKSSLTFKRQVLSTLTIADLDEQSRVRSQQLLNISYIDYTGWHEIQFWARMKEIGTR